MFQALSAFIIATSLSIRRFWGKGERWKRKMERAEGEKLHPVKNWKVLCSCQCDRMSDLGCDWKGYWMPSHLTDNVFNTVNN